MKVLSVPLPTHRKLRETEDHACDFGSPGKCRCNTAAGVA